MTPDEAREHARELLVEVDKGGDPVARTCRLSQRSRPWRTCASAFLTNTWNFVASRRPSANIAARSNSSSIPRMGTFKVQDVTRADIAKLHHDMRDTPYRANRTSGGSLQVVQPGGGMGPATRWFQSLPPCPQIPGEQARTLSDLGRNEVAGAVLAAAERDGSEPRPSSIAIRLLVLTGARLREIQTLKWEYVRPGFLALPDSKRAQSASRSERKRRKPSRFQRWRQPLCHHRHAPETALE